MHYNYHRYYDPLTGRYLSEDPIGVNGGMNLYAYVNGNPVNWIDPYGLWSISDPSTWSPIPQPVVDFAACFGDAISGGLTKMFRDWRDTNKYVDFCSDPCSYGKYSGFALDLLMGGKALWGKGGNYLRGKVDLKI
ncbi:MAG: RHS repeat-associated core domain-containing protein [Gammaproteobacteria bacterium]|nr:RHS repeat-associated core domain-containing protein [Gammaproteobacteria bacterium]